MSYPKVFMKEAALTWVQTLAMTSVCTICSIAAGAAEPLSPDVIRRLESAVVMPSGAKPIQSYDRFYTIENKNGREMVSGIFLGFPEQHAAPAVHIVEPMNMPRVSDGGCYVVHLLYDVQAKRIVMLFCNGVA